MFGTASVSLAGSPLSFRRICGPRRTPAKAMPSAVRNSVQTAPITLTRTASSLYEMLRVKQTASLGEIKTAYRSLAKMYHPDAVGSSSDGQDFIAIHEAYTTLSDPTSRALYDLSLGAKRSRRVGRVGIRKNPTRRWETDQCW